jgi:hypothetical protein
MPAPCAGRGGRELEQMEEFEGGFLRSVIIGLVLALGFSILFVWFR